MTRLLRNLQNPSWFPLEAGHHEGFCKSLFGVHGQTQGVHRSVHVRCLPQSLQGVHPYA